MSKDFAQYILHQRDAGNMCLHKSGTYLSRILWLKLFLILQQSSSINTAKMVQILEIMPAIVNVSNMKPIYPPMECPDRIIDVVISCRIHANVVFAL
jgi:hypothetical protein